MSTFRVLTVGGLIAYRALFNWIHPAIYIPSVLGFPMFQILFFAYLGRFSNLRDDAFFVTGNAVQVAGMAGIYASVFTIGNDRFYGTLGPLLASPASRAALFTGRALPIVANGLFVSAFGFAVGWAFLDFEPPLGSLPLLALVVLASAFATTAFGMLLGSIGLRTKDILLISNLAYFLMWLFCGVNVPLEALPGWMQIVGEGLPVTHAVAAAREVVDGASLSSVWRLIVAEAAIGAGYLIAALVLFRLFERTARQHATLETT
jgi:ABC-2 type transport system permease protein